MVFRSLISVVLISSLAAQLSADEFRFSSDIGLRQIGEPSKKSFVWAKDLGTAFTQAKQLDVPMIVVFTNTNSVQATNFLVELGADGLTEFADNAVFVHVAIPAEGGSWGDPQGAMLVRDLKLTTSPTISVMSPNPLMLNEGYRIEGFFDVSELKPHLAKGIARAMSPDMTWRQTTIPGIVQQFSAAMKTGDLMKYTSCLADPMRSAMEKLVNLNAQIGNSKRRLLAAIDARFGVQAERLAFIEDDQTVSAEFRNTMNVELLNVVSEGERTELRVLFTKRDSAGTTIQEERRMILVRGQQGFRIVNDTATEWCEQAMQLVQQVTPVIADLDRIADGVASGMFADAQTALDLAKSAYNQRKSITATAKH